MTIVQEPRAEGDRGQGGYRLGIDIGGTFTDAVLTRPCTGQTWSAKVLTTDPPQVGALRGADRVIELAGIRFAELTSIVHATTLVPNALLQRRGARVGLITNDGFADIMQIARELRYDASRLSARSAEPIVDRHLCRGVKGRVLADGTEFEALDIEGLRSILRDWREAGVEAIAVCLLHSYRNPVHEELAAKIIAEENGVGFPVSVSSSVAPEVREYERASTTVINAYVQPLIAAYQAELEKGLQERGYTRRLHVMLSSGGIATTDVTAQFPSRLVESGPAAGVLAAARYARASSIGSVVAFDVGGTTAKACAVVDGRPGVTPNTEVARTARFMKGSGLPVQLPSVDLIEIGAGGGSIAWVDELGLLKVGPQSAESRPGPACYGIGGMRPTVTDANLLLGYLNAETFANGTMPLKPELASLAFRELASSLGLSETDAALAVYEVVNETMADALRVHLAENGHDPRKFTMIASGGGGPLHGVAVARKLGIGTVVLPTRAGVLSAVGLLVAAPSVELARSAPQRLTEAADWQQIERQLSELADLGQQMVEEAAAEPGNAAIERAADLRWVGQTHALRTRLPDGPYGADALGDVIDEFQRECARRYGATMQRTMLEALTWRLTVRGTEPVFNMSAPSTGGDPVKGRRTAVFRPEGRVESTVYDRARLVPGFSARGPSIVEEPESTTIVGPRDSFHVDDMRNVVVRVHTTEEAQ